MPARTRTRRPPKPAPPAPEPPAHAPVPVTVTLTAAEHVALQVVARAKGVDVAELLRASALAAIKYRAG